jgi:serine/threonine-protein kinase
MLSPGRTFGRYVIVRPIGRGGMGAVFEAEHVHLRKRVALKTLHAPTVAFDERTIERFLREGRAAASVRHPHVVDVTDVGVEDATPFLVMELLDGEDLAAKLQREAPLPVDETIDLLLPVIDAAAAMHAAGLVHRDLKPENVFLAKGLGGALVPKVLDFGVCRLTDADARRLSSQGGLVGTPYYLSPEQVDGADGDARSDQHALGVLLYECLCGARPYEAPTLLGLLAAIRDGRFTDPRARRADLPAPLVAVVLRAMSPAPSERFESARALGAALLPFASARAREQWSSVLTDARESETLASASRTQPALAEPSPASTAATTVRFGSPERASDAIDPHTDDARPAPSRERRAVSTRDVTAAALAVALVSLATITVAQRGTATTRSTRVASSSPSSELSPPARGAPSSSAIPVVARVDPAPAPRTSSTAHDAGAVQTVASAPERAAPRRAVVVIARRDAGTRPTLTSERATPIARPQRPVVNGAPIVD